MSEIATTLDQSEVPQYRNELATGRCAVVLGAGNGIGRQVAHSLAQWGKKVICVDASEHRAHHVAAEVQGTAVVADVTNREEVERISKFAAEIDDVDCLVDVVGIAHFAPLLETDDQFWTNQSQIVVDHARYAIQVFGSQMARGSTMTFVTSAIASQGGHQLSAYAAAKAALSSLVRSAAVELGPRGIRVNSVAPGVVSTPRMADLLGEEKTNKFAASIPLQKLVEPSEVAHAVTFMALPGSSAISGQTLVVDGGTSAKFPYPEFL